LDALDHGHGFGKWFEFFLVFIWIIGAVGSGHALTILGTTSMLVLDGVWLKLITIL
jgi:hypothetical protein